MTRLREAHCHLFQHGWALTMVRLETCTQSADLLEAFTLAADAQPSGPLIGQGARPEAWPLQRPQQQTDRRWPSLPDFDRVTGNRPAVAWCFDYHALLANSAALHAAGIDSRSPDPAGGVIGRDESANLTGVVYESAALAVWDAIPQPPAAERPHLLRSAIDDLASHGFVEIHDLKTQPWLPSALKDLDPAVTIELWPLVADLAPIVSTRDQWQSSTLRLGGAKIFVDGTLNSRTAAMLQPYADAPPAHPSGMLLMSMDDVAHAIVTADKAGLPISAHAIGDRAVRTVLDAIEAVRPSSRGHRIEHAELIDEADIPRIVNLRDSVGLKISVQPCHLLADIEALERAVPNRLNRVLPLRELIEAGLTPGRDLLFGSDTPIVRPDPIDSIQAATQRKRCSSASIAPEQAITDAQAWSCFESIV